MNHGDIVDPHAIQFRRMGFKVLTLEYRGYVVFDRLFAQLNMRHADTASQRALHQSRVYLLTN